MRPRRAASAIALAGLLLGACAPWQQEPSHEVVAYFRDVGDLVDGATVQINDVEIGAVTDIGLELRDGDMLARVSMRIDEAERVPARGLGALVRQTSLLGEQFVELLPGPRRPPYLGSSEVVIPVEMTDRIVDVETFLGDLSAFVGGGGLEDLNIFTHAQALILEGRGEELGEVIGELETFTGTLARRGQDVAAAIDHLGSASQTLARNRATLDRFFDSFEDANALLADQGDELRVLFPSLRRFGDFNARFLARHSEAINRQFKALRPVLGGLAGAQRDLRVGVSQLRTFFELFPKSFGGGPGGAGKGDYIQAEAVLCRRITLCSSFGERGDVPGEG